MTGQRPARLKERLQASRLRLPGCRIIMYIITIMAAVSRVVPLCFKERKRKKVLRLLPLLD